MIKIRFIFLFCVWFALPLCTQARVKASERYVLRWKSVKVKVANYSSEEWDVWLWDSKRKRVLWKRRLDNFNPLADKESVHWSKDRRALAIDCLAESGWQVLVWREGYRLRDFGVPGDWDYTMGCAWSPDNRRLLVRCGSSGDTDIDIGKLYCLQLQAWPRYKVFKLGIAREFKWKNRKTAVFWNIDENHDYGPNADIPAPLMPPHFWHAP